MLKLLSIGCAVLGPLLIYVGRLKATKSQRERFKFLRKLDGKELYLTFAGVFLFVFGGSATIALECRSGSKESLILAPNGELIQRAEKGDFRSEVAKAALSMSNEAEGFYNEGGLFYASGKFAESVDAYHKSIDKIPTASAYLNQGISLGILGQSKRALESYEAGLQLAMIRGESLLAAAIQLAKGACFADLDWNNNADECLQKARNLYIESNGESGLARVYSNLATVRLNQGRHTEGVEYLDKANAIARKIGDSVALAYMPAIRGTFLAKAGNFTEARANFDVAMRQFMQPRYKIEMAICLDNIGTCFKMQGQPDSALKCSLEALEIFRQLAYVGGEANASHNIGNLFLDQGKGDSAQVYLRASFEMFKAIGNESGVARVISSFGLVALQRGDLSQAEKLERIALQTFVRIGNIEGQFKALTNLGAVFYERDMIREALNTSHKTILLASMMGDSLGMLTANSNIALLLNFQGKVDEALQLERAGLKYARSHGMKEQTAMVLTNLAASYARKGQTELFLEAYTEAYNIFAELREVPKHVLMLQVLGDVLAGSKDFKGALNLGSLALQAASQVGNYREMVKILRSMSRWSAAVGDRRRARECALKAAEIERAGTNPSTVKRDEI